MLLKTTQCRNSRLRLNVPLALAAVFLVSARSARADSHACIQTHEQGLALQAKAKFVEAEAHFVTCARDPCPGIIRQECSRLLEDVQARVPTIVFAISGPDGADIADVRISLDGIVLANRLPGQALRVNPGEHVVHLAASSGDSKELHIVVREGDKLRSIPIQLERGSSAPSPQLSDTTAHSSNLAPSRSTIPTLSYVLGGVGLVAGGLFGYFAITGQQRESDLKSSCSPACAPSDVDPIRNRFLAADISLGLALVSLATAGVIWYTSPDHSQSTAKRATKSRWDVTLGAGVLECHLTGKF